jgi:hypothetical protein
VDSFHNLLLEKKIYGVFYTCGVESCLKTGLLKTVFSIPKPRFWIKRWRRAGGPRRAECAVGHAGEFAFAAPFRIYFSYSDFCIKLFFLAPIFSEPEGFFSVYTPALTGRHFYLVCAGKGTKNCAPFKGR